MHRNINNVEKKVPQDLYAMTAQIQTAQMTLYLY